MLKVTRASRYTINDGCYFTTESEGHKPQARVNAAIRDVESVAKREGLAPDQIDVIMDFVAGKGGGSKYTIDPLLVVQIMM